MGQLVIAPRPAVLALAAILWFASGCREDPPLESSEGDELTTVYEIQTPHDDTEAPSLGSSVFLRSVVVTAFDTTPETSARREQDARGAYYCVEETGYTGAVVVQEIDGGPLSGVSLFNPTLIPANEALGPGDLVDVRGQYLEFCLSGPGSVADSYCNAANTNRLTQLGNASVRKVGETQPPEPLEISAADLLNTTFAEQFEGVLVRVRERLEIRPCQPLDSQGRPTCCVGAYDRYGNLETSGGFSLTNEYYSLPDRATCVTSVTGIVSWFGHATDWGAYSLSPRGDADVEIPADCRP